MIVVQYRPKPDQVDHNQELVEAVFEELREAGTDGVRYATLRLEDGSFLHIADIEADPSPLGSVAAFARFQEGIAERCEPGEGPDARPATVVGNHRLFR